MNHFIVTNQGFVKSISFDIETKCHTIEYTDKLRYAQAFHTKNAKMIMAKHNLSGFIYSPYAQEPVRDMYEVKRISHYSYEEDNDLIEEWEVRKAIMVSESDANFLQSRKLAGRNLMTLEEAQAKALKLNVAMLTELHNKIDKLKSEMNHGNNNG